MAMRGGVVGLVLCGVLATSAWAQTRTATKRPAGKPLISGETAAYDGAINAAPKLHPLAETGANWLLKTQQADGGWAPYRLGLLGIGGGNAPAKSDYSTSAMAGLALVRAGANPNDGKTKESLRKAIEFVAANVGAEKVGGGLAGATEFVDDMGSQPSYKLGPLAGPAHATQFLSRVLPMLKPDDPLREPVLAALKTTVKKLESADHAFLKSFGKAEDGSYLTKPPAQLAAAASFSPTHHVLIALTALETAQAAGVEVDDKVLDKQRAMMRGLVDPRTGAIDLQQVLSIELYSFSSAMRSTAIGARAAAELCGPKGAKLKPQGVVDLLAKQVGDEATVQELTNEIAAQQALTKRLIAGDKTLMNGFGNHGGEEFLSYLLMSEAFVLGGDPRAYETWKAGLADRLVRLQNADGSWTGMHCITDPVYMTAAAVQSLTADRDEPLLVEIARQRAKAAAGKSPSEK